MWTIIFFVLFLMICWCVVDFVVGRRFFIANVVQRKYPTRYSDIELIASGPDVFRSIFKDIREAKSSIHILFYIVQNDHLGHRFLELLEQKAKEGVEVRLLVDRIGSYAVPKDRLKRLKEAGGEFYFSQKPKPPFFFFSLQQRNHRKVTIIDGQVGYLGGYNVGKEYIDEDPKLSPWRDYHMRIVGEGTQDLQKEFLLDWERASKIDLCQNQKYFPLLHKGKSKHQFVPTDGVKIEQTFTDLIDSAEEKIIIGTPYFIPSKNVFTALRDALSRGVELSILVPQQSDHLLVKEASFTYFRTLIKEGAKVHQFQEGFFHAKVMMIDDKVCDIGTANFDKRSFFLNFEMNNLLFDPVFIKIVEAQIQRDLQASTLMDLEKLHAVGFTTRIKEQIAGVISILL